MKWIFPKEDKRTILERIYFQRGITDREKFLNPKIDDLYDPMLLHDMPKAVDLIISYAKAKKKIFIHGDYDVDGISATTLLWSFLYNELKADVYPYIPSRFTEGYGLSEESINSIIKEGGEVVITVDCGIKDIEIVNKYKDKLAFIITDHHSPLSFETDKNKDLPKGGKEVNDYLISSDAKAVVHPKLNDYQFKELCGSAVALKLIMAISKKLGLETEFSKYFELAGLGTICDVMPLIDENRIICALAIKALRNSNNEGINALVNVAQIERGLIDSYHIGFVLGPRLNASGRMESAMDAVRLLTTKNKIFAKELANKLEELNKLRQKTTAEVIELAEKAILEQKEDFLYFIVGENWSEGIIGLAAGKLMEKYQRPIIVGTRLKDGIIKASARSLEVFNISYELSLIEKLLKTYGGHSQAAGLSFTETNFEEIKESLQKSALAKLTKEDLEKKIYIDAVITDEDLLVLAKELQQLAPFGLSNQKPKLALLAPKQLDYSLIGKTKTHIKLRLIGSRGEVIEAIKFSDPKFIEEVKANWLKKDINLLGTLDINYWNGTQKATFKIDDYKFGEVDKNISN